MRQRHFLPASKLLALSGFLLLIVPSHLAMAEGGDGEAEMAESGSMDDHEAASIDPDSLEAESHQMVEGMSEDPAAMTVGSDEADVVDSGRLEDHEGGSTALQNLTPAPRNEGLETIDDGRLGRADDASLSAEQLLAKRRLARAQSNATAARTRYGDMMRDNYPRGEARVRIVDQRDASMDALMRARSEFDKAMAN